MRAMDAQSPHRIEAATIAVVGAEIVASVAVVTGVVALLDEVAPVTGLGILYILAVLFIAVRRGQVAALATAVLSVLALNFFFIEPRYRLTIADSHNVVALGVFLVVALVVGRLAATARTQTAEAERRALLASAREREAMILGAGGLLLPRGRERRDAARAAGRSRRFNRPSRVSRRAHRRAGHPTRRARGADPGHAPGMALRET